MPKSRFQTCLVIVATVAFAAGCARVSPNPEMAGQTAAADGKRAAQISQDLRGPLQSALNAAENVAQAFQSMQAADVTDRQTYNAVLREVLERNPEFIGTWSAWEPDALDGKDSQFVNAPAHDETGRFIPYWNRGSGEVVVEALVDYEVPGAGDYYILPRDTGRKMIMEPFFYNVAGKDVFLTTLAVPIIVDGKVVGVSGVDISLDKIRDMLAELDLDEDQHAFLVSNSGIVAAHEDRSKIGKNLADLNYGQDTVEAVARGQSAAVPDPSAPGQSNVEFAPMRLEGTESPWSVAVISPTN